MTFLLRFGIVAHRCRQLSASWLLLLLLLLLNAGCEHREFEVEEDTSSKRVPVVVEFDWSLAPDAKPAEMTVYFFRLGSNSRPIAYDLRGQDGGRITLSPNLYAAICHNNDSDRHGFVGYNSFEEFGLHLNDNVNAGHLANPWSYIKSADERIAHTPDRMWVGSIATVEIKEVDALGGDAPQVVRFEMHPIVSHYTFIITNPENFTKSLSVSATLTGMAGTYHPGPGIMGDETVTHLFDLIPTPDGNLYGEMLTFGHCGADGHRGRADDDTSIPHVFTIHATLADGQPWTSVHDVTGQIHNSASDDCVIRLDSVAFPKPTDNGFQPSVGGWTGTQEPIGM